MRTQAVPLLALLLALCLLATAANAVTPYTITDLGTLPGGTESAAFGVNDSGQAVGWADDASRDNHAFLWENGVMSDLGTLGGDRSHARGVNDLGQAVGSADTSDNHEHAFVWLPEPCYGLPAGMNDLGTFGGTLSRAYDINESGQVTGEATTTAISKRAFLWSNGTMTDLGSLGGEYSAAFGINELGQVVGLSQVQVNGPMHAFVWLSQPAYGMAAGLNDLGTIGDANSAAFGINDMGQVVGVYTPPGAERHAFLWEDGVMRPLGTLGGTMSTAGRINNQGQVVGASKIIPGDDTRHAFLYTDGTMVDLNDLIPADSGWELNSALNINDRGQIVGYGYIGSQRHAFLLTPIPEPCSPGLAAIAALALMISKRRSGNEQARCPCR